MTDEPERYTVEEYERNRAGLRLAIRRVLTFIYIVVGLTILLVFLWS